MGISIIIPCYQRELQLARCLKSISKSRGLGKNFEYEILVVENGPKSVVKHLVHKFRNLNLKYFWLKKRGVASSRNFAAKRAKNRILVFCDSDIEVKQDTLWQTILTFKNNPYAALISGKIFWKGTKELDRPKKTDRFYRYKGIIFAECFYGRYTAALKEAFLKVGCFDDKLFNFWGLEVDLSTKFWRAGFPLVFNPKIQVYHEKEAPFSMIRKMPARNVMLFKSMILHTFKFDASLKTSPYRAKSLDVWGREDFGKNLPFVILESSAKSIDWIGKNYKNILKAKERIPKVFDFKPEDTFSNKKLLLRCLSQAPRRLTKMRETLN